MLGRWDNPVGVSRSASQGVAGNAEIEARPRLRTGEILEVVPGLIVTQHSGSGKSNQMFLRGFNLDHGTDFATFVDGMPVNLPTHGHGQGYTDLNFLIPELVERLEYRKGAYYAEVADFSSAGAAYLSTYRQLDEGLVKVGLGGDGYLTALAADSVALGARQPHLRRSGESLRRTLDRHRRGRDAQSFARPLCGRRARRRRLERGAHGLRRDLEFGRPSAAPRARERLDHALRLARLEPRRRELALQRLGRLERRRRPGPSAVERLHDRLRPRVCSRTSRTSSTTRSTAISSSSSTSAASPAASSAYSLGADASTHTFGAIVSLRRHRRRRAVPHAQSRALVDGAPRLGGRARHRRLLRERDALERPVPQRARRARRPLRVRRDEQSRRELGHGERRRCSRRR